MSGCGSCSACGSGDKSQEYRNEAGLSAVKCPLCDVEITFEKMPANRRIQCPECGTVIEISPLLLN